MNRLPSSFAWIVTATLALGCGGNVIGGSGGNGSGGSGSGGNGGNGGTTTTTPVPAECAVATNDPAPYNVFFQFTVTSGLTLYLASDCYTNYSITSCADGYVTPLGIHADCTVDCSETMGCIECGACPQSAVAVSMAAPAENAWAGDTYTFGQTSEGCSCHNAGVAPAGKYRITVPVYTTEQDALNHTNGVDRSFDFTLPAPNGVVVLPIDTGLD